MEKGGENKADQDGTRDKISNYMTLYWGTESVGLKLIKLYKNNINI